MSKDTPNHGYKRPQRGQKNWHTPLNENFARIDADIEIRDEEANMGQYEPKEEAKYVATDTKRIYLGDGDGWQRFGRVGATEGESRLDGTIVAPPGALQSVLDSVEPEAPSKGTAPQKTITLRSGTTYEIDSTIELKPGHRIDCNGARIVPTGDFNLFELHENTGLISPFCDTQARNWDSTQIVIGAEDAGKLEVSSRAWVRDAYLLGDFGRGIGLQFRGGNKPCSIQVANGSIDGFDKALDFYAAGGNTSGQGDWTNGNQFYGRIRGYRIGINMRSEGASVGGNTVAVQAQANPSVSEWLWYMQDDPRSTNREDDKYNKKGNCVQVHPWDVQNYENNPYYENGDRKPPIWYIGEGKSYGNAIIDNSGNLSNQFVVNNSDNPDRNGIFTAHGGFVTGTTQFKNPPAYQQNNSRIWHKASKN